MHKRTIVLKSQAQARRLFHDTLKGSSNKFAAFNDIREWLPANLMVESIEWAKGLGDPYLRFALKRNPDDLAALNWLGPFNKLSEKRELGWTLAMFESSRTLLNFYLERRESLIGNILHGDYDAANTAVNAIEDILGKSYWSMKMRLGIVQVAEGTDRQKKLSKQLAKNLDPRSIQAFILHHSSVKNEPSVRIAQYCAHLATEITKTGLAPDWQAFLLYTAAGERLVALPTAYDIMRHASAASIVDHYEAFIHLNRTALRSECQLDGAKLVQEAAYDLSNVIVDKRLLEAAPQGMETLSKLSQPATALATQPGSVMPVTVTVSELASSLDTYLQPAIMRTAGPVLPGLAGVITRHMTEIWQAGDESESAATELERLAENLPAVELCGVLNAMRQREETNQPIGDSSTGAPAVKEARARMLYLLGHVGVAEPFAQRYYADASLALQAPPHADTVSPDEEYLRLVHAERRLASAEYEHVIHETTVLATSQNTFIARSAVRLKAHAHLALGDLIETVRLINRISVEGKPWMRVLPLIRCADALDKHLRREMRGELAPAIVLSTYQREVDGAHDATLRNAFAEVMKALGERKPSGLHLKEMAADKNELVDFLFYVCTPEVIYVTGAYANARELQEERIAILEWLRELAPNLTTLFQSELVERTRRVVLQARRAQIEQSKVQLDLESFVRDAETRVGPNYERYLTLLRLELIQNEPAVSTTTENTEVKASSAPRLRTAVPRHERPVLFASVVEDLVDLFIGNRYHGLDGCISTRIRHGVLENELRSPLTSANIITLRDKASGIYRPNRIWADELKGEQGTLKEALLSCLATFSEEFDELVAEIRDKWLQVRRSSSGSGMVEVALSENAIRDIEEVIIGAIPAAPPLSYLATGIFQLLAQELQPSLEAIRRRLSDEGRGRALSLIQRLERQLDERGISIALPELINTVRESATAMQRAFERVAGWLTLSYENIGEPLPVRDVVEIASEMAIHFDPRFAAQVTVDSGANDMVPGGSITPFTDILLTLFDNVAKHAELGDSTDVEVSVRRNELHLQFTVRNRVGSAVDINKVRERIESRLTAISDGSYLRDSQIDHGTGLWRIHHIIRSGFRIDPQLSAKVAADRTVTITFELPSAA